MPTFLASWFRKRELDIAAERQLARIALETGNVVADPSRSRLPGDGRALRGIPVVGFAGGCGGAIRGTRPEVEIERLDH